MIIAASDEPLPEVKLKALTDRKDKSSAMLRHAYSDCFVKSPYTRRMLVVPYFASSSMTCSIRECCVFSASTSTA